MHKLTIPLVILALLCLITGPATALMLSYSTRYVEISKDIALDEALDKPASSDLVSLLSGLHHKISETNHIASAFSLGLGIVSALALITLAMILNRYSRLQSRAISAEDNLHEEIAKRYENQNGNAL